MFASQCARMTAKINKRRRFDISVHWFEGSEVGSVVGMKLPPGEWFLISQDRINRFADCTEDFQFIHVDQSKAQETIFEGTIAHGFLTLSMLTKLCEGSSIAVQGIVMGLNYGFDKVRFLKPVTSGSRVRASSEVISASRKDSNRYLIKLAVTVEIEGSDTPAIYAEWLTMQLTD